MPKISKQPSRAKIILSKCKNSEEISVECALWTAEILGEYQYWKLPDKPEIVKEHEAIPEEDRATFNQAYYDTHPLIKQYYERLREVKVHNDSNTHWLLECQELLQKTGHIIQAQLIADKLEKEVR